MSAPLPLRPRLAEHALVRRHVIDGREIVVVHDARSGDLVRMGSREWDLVAGADGTRDLDAIVLAAARRGVLRRASEIAAVLSALAGAGLLADGIEPPPLPDAGDPGRPLDVLPRFTLTCDGNGACCSMYGSVSFSPLEAARARALRPDVLAGGDREGRVFTPERGSSGEGNLAVALVDGRCAYLEGDGRCSLHRVGGEASKPRGCQLYPATFVDDGEHVRVSVGVECPCVLASVDRPGGAPLVDRAATTRGDLGAAARVTVLPAQIALGGGAHAGRAAFVAWARALASTLPDERRAGESEADLAAIFWSLAGAIEAAGLDEEAARRAVTRPSRPDAEALAPWIEALVRRAHARVAAADAWRAAADRSRNASRWIAAAAEGLLDRAALAAALADAGRLRRDEAFLARASVHGHVLVGEAPLATALRDRAVRFVVARVLPGCLPAGDGARSHPLSLVEAMMRGHGLQAYAGEVRS